VGVLRAVGVHVVVIVIVVVVIVCVVRAIEMIVVMPMLVLGGRSCGSKDRKTAVTFGSHVRKPRCQSFEHPHSFESHEHSIVPIYETKLASMRDGCTGTPGDIGARSIVR